MSGAHAPVGFSSLALAVACEASVSLQNAVPALPETDEEAEGTAAHLVAAWAAQGRLLAVDERFQSAGRTYDVDIDMHNGAKMYVQALGGFHSNLRLEDPVRASRIHPEHCWGTPDAWRVFDFKEWAKLQEPTMSLAPLAGRTDYKAVVRVAEYKYGHRYVEVFENWQLIGQAVGVMERCNLLDTDVLLELILVQPRSYETEGRVRRWIVPATSIRDLVNIAFNKVAAAFGDKPVAHTGTHCQDCKARHVCDTLRYTTANIVDFSKTAELNPLDATAMGQELRILDAALKRLESRRTGLAVAAEAALRGGASVPFYELAPRRSNIAWNDDLNPQHIAAAFDILGVSVSKPFAVMTPRQAIDAGVDESIVMQYAHRPPGALALKASNATALKKAFGASRT